MEAQRPYGARDSWSVNDRTLFGRISRRCVVETHTVRLVAEALVPNEKRMRLRYAGVCHLCDTELPKGSDAVYERAAKTVRCVTCVDVPMALAAEGHLPAPEVLEDIDPGVPGASARRKFERHHARREEQIRGKHKRLGGLILALSDDPQSTRAWGVGAIGEERLGARLNELAGDSMRVLHDRGIPRSAANIDHLSITPMGVLVIDAKRYKGRPRLVVEGGLIRTRVEKLVVDGRDRTKLVDGALKQVEVVRGLVGVDVPVRGVLCFVDSDWPLIGGAFTTRGVEVLRPKKLYPMLKLPGPLSDGDIDRVHRLLAARLAQN